METSGLPQLPQHIILTEILPRLSAITLLKLRCVCKTWGSLISNDPTFIKMQLRRSIENPSTLLFIFPKTNEYIEGDPDPGDDNRGRRLGLALGHYRFHHIRRNNPERYFRTQERYMYFAHVDSLDSGVVRYENPLQRQQKQHQQQHDDAYLVGSCNGLVCFFRKNMVCLFNPLTREYKVVEFEEDLPSVGAGAGAEAGARVGVKVSFDYEFVVVVSYGFGYDPTSQDYKFLQIQIPIEKCKDKPNYFEARINVYSLNDTSSSTTSHYPYDKYCRGVAVYLNGALHWLIDSNPESIICFVFGENSFHQVSCPDRPRIKALGLLGTQLCLLTMGHWPSHDVDLWVMKTYGESESWCKLLSFKDEVVGRPIRNSYPILEDPVEAFPATTRPLCFNHNGEILLEDERSYQRDLVLYSPNLNACRILAIQNTLDWNKMNNIVTLAGSLVQLNSGTYLGATTINGDKDGENAHSRQWLRFMSP